MHPLQIQKVVWVCLIITLLIGSSVAVAHWTVKQDGQDPEWEYQLSGGSSDQSSFFLLSKDLINPLFAVPAPDVLPFSLSDYPLLTFNVLANLPAPSSDLGFNLPDTFSEMGDLPLPNIHEAGDVTAPATALAPSLTSSAYDSSFSTGSSLASDYQSVRSAIPTVDLGVAVQQVPEPGSTFLFLLGGISLLASFKFRKR